MFRFLGVLAVMFHGILLLHTDPPLKSPTSRSVFKSWIGHCQKRRIFQGNVAYRSRSKHSSVSPPIFTWTGAKRIFLFLELEAGSNLYYSWVCCLSNLIKSVHTSMWERLGSIFYSVHCFRLSTHIDFCTHDQFGWNADQFVSCT